MILALKDVQRGLFRFLLTYLGLGLGRHGFTVVDLVEDAMNSGGDPAVFVTLANALALQTEFALPGARVGIDRGGKAESTRPRQP